jgi:hypothetical protein
MAVITGTTGVDATPATTLYNLLATALLANGNWTEQADSPVSAANAGTTDIVRVWKCTGGVADFYVFIEVDNTNLRLRFRLAETWNTGTHRLQQPAGGGTTAAATDTTSVTPTANGTVTDADTTIGSTNPNVSFVQLNVLGTAFNYLYEVRDNLLTVSTRVSSVNYYCVVGCFTSLVQALSDTSPLVLLGHPANTGMSGTVESANASNSGRFTRLPGFGAVAQTGAFNCAALPLLMPIRSGAALTANANTFSSIGGTVSNPWFSNHLVMPIILHGMTAGALGNRRGMRGTLPDFLGGYFTNEPASAGVDTLTVNGSTYYPLGLCRDIGSGASWSLYLAIKG